jgi:hypothetical protein
MFDARNAMPRSRRQAAISRVFDGPLAQGLAGPKRDGAARAIIVGRQDLRETRVDPGHERLARAEVAAQTLHLEAHLADPLLRELQKGTHLRLPETIDGLHRVADAKNTSAIVLGPSCRQ